MKLELRAARIPVVGPVAHHHWLVVFGEGEPVRWEIWQRRNVGGRAWGHLHRDLMAFDRGVGNGPSWVVHTWYDADARKLAARLAAAPDHYPWRYRYLFWPGPNSNTFAAWIIGDPGRLGWRGWGRGYPLWGRARCRPAPL